VYEADHVRKVLGNCCCCRTYVCQSDGEVVKTFRCTTRYNALIISIHLRPAMHWMSKFREKLQVHKDNATNEITLSSGVIKITFLSTASALVNAISRINVGVY